MLTALVELQAEADGVDGPQLASMCHCEAVELTTRRPFIMQIATIGIDLAKQVFQVTASDRTGVLSCARGCVALSSSRSSPNCHRVSSVWRPVHPRIIGRAS
jgi:hypothetical protein